jgi:hypothetical protein
MRRAERALVEAMAAALLETLHVDPEPPVDPFSLARRCGVPVSWRSIAEDGRVERTQNGSRIVLSRGASNERQRFTLAHELAHVLLDDPDVASAARQLSPRIDDIEQFCNEFAAELLMPREWIRRRFNRRPETLETLRLLMEEAHVSHTAAFIQLARHASWSSALLFFDERRNWTPVTLAGAPRSASGALKPIARTCEIVHLVHARNLHNEERTLQLEGRRGLLFVRAELAAVSRGVLALAFFRSAPVGY